MKTTKDTKKPNRMRTSLTLALAGMLSAPMLGASSAYATDHGPGHAACECRKAEKRDPATSERGGVDSKSDSRTGSQWTRGQEMRDRY